MLQLHECAFLFMIPESLELEHWGILFKKEKKTRNVVVVLDHNNGQK